MRVQAVIDVFLRFMSLGFVSFGGPAAHLGYFRKAFVEKQGWLTDEDYMRLVALSQFLPGPGSSQVGFAIGLQRAGLAGGIAAFIGFTAPSFILLLSLAMLPSSFQEGQVFAGIIHGLKLLAVIVVADAVIAMYGNFCKQRLTASIAITAAAVLLLLPSLTIQLVVLLLAAVIGASTMRSSRASDQEPVVVPAAMRISWLPLLVFAGLFFILPWFVGQHQLLALFSDFFQAGSLVFGGGHVVLPLLQEIVADSMSNDRFLTAYAAAQAIPGPMFTLATFLGADLHNHAPVLGALVATLGIFLPGFLLLLAVHHGWRGLVAKPGVAGAMAGVNAAVVGLLIAAFYQPVFTSGVLNAHDAAAVVLGLFLLRVLKFPVIALVGLSIAAGLAMGW